MRGLEEAVGEVFRRDAQDVDAFARTRVRAALGRGNTSGQARGAWLPIMGVVLLVVGVVSVGLVAPGLFSSGTSNAGVNASPQGPRMLPTASSGAHYVGLGRTVVAVPDSWETTAPQYCRVSRGAAVMFDSGVVVNCPNQRSDAPASSVLVIDTTGAYGRRVVGQMQRAGEVDGRPKFERPVSCNGTTRECSGAVAVPAEGAAFVVNTVGADADGELRRILNSLRVLADGFTTVPLTTGRFPYTPTHGSSAREVDLLIAAMRTAGLKPVTEAVASEGVDSGAFVGSVPALGAPVRNGQRVTIEVAE